MCVAALGMTVLGLAVPEHNADTPSMKPKRVVESFPLSRVGTFDVGVIGRRKHHITGLLEVDVTTARERMRRLRREGRAVSFNAWFLKTIADTVKENPQVHGVIRGRRL